MKDTELELSLYQNITQLAAAYRYHLGKLAESFHLTGAQLHSLLSLTPGEAVPMKHLCAHLSCDPSYITSIIDRLVAEKLIERHEAPDDRRIKMISLTQKGEHLRQLAITHLPDFAPTAKLTASEKQTLHTLLAKMS